MRIAVVSDIHGNLAAFDAVLAELRDAAPDLILHGGDLADSGSSPAEVVDRIRELGWAGVRGNGDEMLADPGALAAFATQAPASLLGMFACVSEMAAASREALGSDRLAWLGALPRVHRVETGRSLALVHASPADVWRSPGPEAEDTELAGVYGALGCGLVAYGHVHRGFVRRMPALTVANCGSVSLSYDGDPRASYLLVDDGVAQIRRVVYDVDREQRSLAAKALPHAEWVARMLGASRFVMP